MAPSAVALILQRCAIGNAAEWLAHELEHVIEQVDGVRLGDIVDRGACGGAPRARLKPSAPSARAVWWRTRCGTRLAARQARLRDWLIGDWRRTDPMPRGDD